MVGSNPTQWILKGQSPCEGIGVIEKGPQAEQFCSLSWWMPKMESSRPVAKPRAGQSGIIGSILKNKTKEKPSVFLRTEGFLYFYFVVSERTFLAAFGSIVRRIPVSGSTSRVTGAVCLRHLKTFKGSLRGFTPHPTNFLKKVGSKTFKPVASSFLPRRPASSWRLPASAAADPPRRRELWTQSFHCSAFWR